MSTVTITLNLDPITAAYLSLLPGGLQEGVERLVHSAADGIRRPGAWERAVLDSLYGPDVIDARIDEQIDAGFFRYNRFGQVEPTGGDCRP